MLYKELCYNKKDTYKIFKVSNKNKGLNSKKR